MPLRSVGHKRAGRPAVCDRIVDFRHCQVARIAAVDASADRKQATIGMGKGRKCRAASARPHASTTFATRRRRPHGRACSCRPRRLLRRHGSCRRSRPRMATRAASAGPGARASDPQLGRTHRLWRSAANRRHSASENVELAPASRQPLHDGQGKGTRPLELSDRARDRRSRGRARRNPADQHRSRR